MKKELIYILLCLIVLYALLGFPMDLNTLLQDSTLDINVHDTYVVIDAIDYIMSMFVFTFSFLYFLRVLFTKFKNRLVNYLYIIFNGLFIIICFFIIQLTYVITQEGGLMNYYGENANFPLFISILITIIAICLEVFVILKIKKK
ncbi:hypothetical protein [uncultured Kordia sp.]|uniref:hypothetical protein n=1 Tax=uncultured Kordia sp. TaxID=507699 RepID=UPI002634EF03|nr:hypothetical protein [uncultured Kordia sp.]